MENELRHWGIKGMKWGVRRWQNPDGTLTEAGKAHYARKERIAEKKSERRMKKALKNGKNVRKLTDDELRKVKARMQMEKDYKDLMKQARPQSRAKKLVVDVAEQGVKSLAQAGFTALGKKLFDRDKSDYSTVDLENMDNYSDQYLSKAAKRKENEIFLKTGKKADQQNNGDNNDDKRKSTLTKDQAKNASDDDIRRARRRKEDRDAIFGKDWDKDKSKETKSEKDKSSADRPYTEAASSSSKSSGKKKTKEYEELKVDAIFDSEDDYLDSVWGTDRKRKDLAVGRWSDVGMSSKLNDFLAHYGVEGPSEVDDFLAHHGILGMKWGVRRFQNKDGSLTAAGRARYNVGEARDSANEKKLNLGVIRPLIRVKKELRN